MLTMKWINDNDGRLIAVWNENLQNRRAEDFLPSALSTLPLRAGGPPGNVPGSPAQHG